MKKLVNEDQTEILLEIGDERLKQDLEYHKALRTPGQWSAILGKQVGQLNEALLQVYFNHEDQSNIRKQLIQIAAVSVAWLEQIDEGC